ncbi:MAG: ThiF family adenylyltransferase [Planctomycetes bacterium]|nr:ThiF family adenylyltransferase [Planctomycetota bacterium]
MDTARPDRYARQALFPEIGPLGQERIARSRVAVVGVGALGCQEAAFLARAGIGLLRLIDRDFVEIDNLHRQTLYTEEDAAGSVPKAEAARRHLVRANSAIAIEARVCDLAAGNIDALLGGSDVIVDGSDNFEARYLVNDFAVKNGIPWIYAGAVGATGLLMPVLPGMTACLRCVFQDVPPAGSTQTCDTAGVLGPAPGAVGSCAALEALKLAAGRADAVRRGLLQIDLWSNEVRSIDVAGPRADCPCCGRRSFPFLEVREGGAATSLCGRDAVQVTPPAAAAFDFEAARERICRAAAASDNGFLLRFRAAGLEVTLFRDGRAIFKGTADPSKARAAYARFVGT